MTDPRLEELRRAYLEKERTKASMDKGYVASGTDPFGLTRSTLGGQRTTGGDDSRRSSNSVPKPNNTMFGRPPLKQRLAVQTIVPSVSHDEDSPDRLRVSSPASALTTPTSNGGTPPSTMGASMRPVNLSVPSPQHTAFLQITTSPDVNRLQPSSRRMTTESAGTSRFSQSMLTQVQSQLRMTQSDLQSAREEKRQIETQYQQQVIDLQAQLQQLQAQVGTSQALAVKESQLDQLQTDLQAKATELQRQEHVQQERLDQEWERLQTTIAELEASQLQEENRLQDWANQLDEKQSSIQQALEQLQKQQQAQDNLIKRETNRLDNLRERLVSWEERLQEQALSLDNRLQSILREEEANRTAKQQLELERAEIDDAVRELELQSSSAEARFELVEQALLEATQKRQHEEIKLSEASEKQKQAMAHAEKIMSDCQQVQASLELKHRSAEEEYAMLQDEIDEKTIELDSLNERLRVFMAEDNLQQERANARLEEVDRKVRRILGQVEAATREKEALSKLIADKTVEYDKLVQSIRAEEDEWSRRHSELIRQREEDITKLEREIQKKQSALREAEEEAAQSLKKAEAEVKRILTESSQKVAEMVAEASLHMESSHVDIEAKSTKLESLSTTLQQAANSLGAEKEKLKIEMALCDDLASSLNEKLAIFSSSEVCEKRRRDELEWEVERLSSLLRNERESNLKRTDYARDELESEREMHRAELRSVSARIDEAEAANRALQEQVDSLRKSLDNERAEHLIQFESMVEAANAMQRDFDNATVELEHARESMKTLIDEKTLLKRKLDEVERKAEALRLEKEHLVIAVARAADEGNKMECLMKSLESQLTRAEAKEAELDAEREKTRKQGAEYTALLEFIQQEETRVAAVKDATDLEKDRFKVEKQAFDHERKQHALRKIFGRRLRQDDEAISAALSKWVRSTLFDMAEEETQLNEKVLALKKQISVADVTCAELESARDALLANERRLRETQLRLESDLEACKAAEAGVREELEGVRHDVSIMQQEIHSLQADKVQLTTELETMKKAEQPDISAGNGNNSGTYHDVEQRIRRMEALMADREAELQKKIDSIGERENALKLQKRQFTVQFEEADGRMRETAELLRKKELEMELKETRLATELAKCKETHNRLHKLALSIQAKAQQVSNDQSALATRMKECDELESQLSEWQKRLEAFKFGM